MSVAARADSPPPAPPATEKYEPVFTAEEISKHNTEESAWVVIHGKVHDVTKVCCCVRSFVRIGAKFFTGLCCTVS